jgi:lysosomal alpha-mannosidase
MKKHHSHLTSSNDILTVHLIQHSHDDVGWLKTVDNYFYGGDTSTQWAGVQYTIDTVVSELASNQNYKFSIV